MKKEVSSGWFAISVGINMLVEENYDKEIMKEKFSEIVDYLFSSKDENQPN